jgi:hypothetical protein
MNSNNGFNEIMNNLEKMAGRFGYINISFDLTNSTTNNFDAVSMGVLDGFSIGGPLGTSTSMKLDDSVLKEYYLSTVKLLMTKCKKININIEKYPTIDLNKLSINGRGYSVNVIGKDKDVLIEMLTSTKESILSSNNNKVKVYKNI